ncbi:MAG TPA: hypothetical protein VHB20_08690 [Verrucomicrobiae bacterium]|jgi:hypothetical protein|nr:hypothetical protein [Verrucomicrobiae bacterium]
MKKRKVTRGYLRKSLWWWHWPKIKRYGPSTVDWNAVTREAARNYELARRAPGGESLKPYPDLTSNERTTIHSLWCNWAKHPWRFAMQEKQFNEKGWTAVFPYNPPVQWNIQLPDAVLVEAFRKQIEVTRQIQGIPVPRAIKFKKHREVSWKYIEALDLREHGIGQLDDSERHMASDGRRMGIAFLQHYQQAIADTAREPVPLIFQIEDSFEGESENITSKVIDS